MLSKPVDGSLWWREAEGNTIELPDTFMVLQGDGILAAVRLGLTNARLEGLHSEIRLLSHRSFAFTPRSS